MIIKASHAALIILSGLAVSLATSIFEKCTSHDQCPSHAKCRPTGCEGYTCRCDVNYVYDKHHSSCLTARRIGHSCNGKTTKCLSNFAICADNECQCNELMEKTLDGRCKDPAFSVLEESCQIKDCAGGTICQDGTCVCPEHLRQLTEEEFWIDPMNTDTCIDKDFSIHHCNGTRIEIPEGLLSTPTLSKGTPILSKDTPPSEPSAINVPVSSPNNTKIYDRCLTNKECPVHAQCRPQGCKGYSCLCDEGHMATTNRLSCVRAAKVNEPCDTKSSCMSPFAFCDGVCRCMDVFMPTSDGRCKLPDISFGGEKCSAEECEYPATCVGGVCQCVGEYRAVTPEEFWIDPTNIWQCAKTNTSLDTCNGQVVSLPSTVTPSEVTNKTEPTSSITVSTEIPRTTSEKGPTTPDDRKTSVSSILSTTGTGSDITNVTDDSRGSGFQTTSTSSIKTSTMRQEGIAASTTPIKHDGQTETTESEIASTENTASGVTKQQEHFNITSRQITTTELTTVTGSDSDGVFTKSSTSTESLTTRSSQNPNHRAITPTTLPQVDTNTTTLVDTTSAITMTPHQKEKSKTLITSSETTMVTTTGTSVTVPAVDSSISTTLNPLLTGLNEGTSTTMETKAPGSLVTTTKSLESTSIKPSEITKSSEGTAETINKEFSTAEEGLFHKTNSSHASTKATNKNISNFPFGLGDHEHDHYLCESHSFICSEILCIPSYWVCDGKKQCTDGRDESPVICNSDRVCPRDEYQCSNFRCIPGSWLCDGEEDCPYREDESTAAGCLTTTNTTLTNITLHPEKEDRESAEKSYTGTVGLGSLESIAIAAAAGLVFLINVIGIILAFTRRNRRKKDKQPPSTIHTSVTSSDDTESGNFKIPRPNVLYPPYYVKEDWNTWNSSHFNQYTEQMYATDEHSDFYPGSLKSV